MQASNVSFDGFLLYEPWLTNGTDTDVTTCFQPEEGKCLGAGIDADLITATNITCNGAANGAIDVMMEEGIAPFTYAWSKDDVDGFASTEDLSILQPGVYKLTVTDANGSIDNTFEINIPEPIVGTITTYINIIYGKR